MSKKETLLTEGDISRLIEMAWEDKTPFEAILKTYQLDEPSLMRLMQKHLKPSSYRLWRKRVKERSSKHLKLDRLTLSEITALLNIKLAVKLLWEW